MAPRCVHFNETRFVYYLWKKQTAGQSKTQTAILFAADWTLRQTSSKVLSMIHCSLTPVVVDLSCVVPSRKKNPGHCNSVAAGVFTSTVAQLANQLQAMVRGKASHACFFNLRMARDAIFQWQWPPPLGRGCWADDLCKRVSRCSQR